MSTCDLGPFLYDQVPSPGDETGLQLSQEQLQGYLSRLLDAVCTDITALQNAGGGSGVTTFLGLTDTPSSYSGQAGMAVKVNGAETGLEFGSIAAVETEGQTLDYSTSEQSSPRSWHLANSQVYQKTISFGALPNATTKNVAHNITNIDRVVRHEFWAKRASDGTQVPLPHVNNTAIGSALQLLVNNTNVQVRTSANYSAYDGEVTLYYTRT